ncbi:MAG TPA: prenyltransferase/squalene oxidase repeat-containing protein [Bryobacteraceae bacterium]|nr:prenyltransferase/squalene oxidase repeat-containing protein [Bryobacteraceae bacterium]
MLRSQVTRRGFMLSAISVASCSRSDSREGVRKAAQYLWAQQAEDGGWHSRAYGLLRSGQSLTPFVLDALLDLPDRSAEAVDRAVAFIKRNINSEGSLGMMDSAAVDYPNYATGLAIRALVRAKASGLEPMVSCLRAQQFTEDGGWRRDDPPYGAWGMGGVRLTPPNAGHVDLAMTRYVLEGLAAAGVPASDPAMQKALVYLERCQNPDGGFYFSTVNPEINKAGEHRSYGTTTADGVLALRAAGVPENDVRITSAKKWLRDHHLIDRVPGFEGPREEWSLGLRFYYAAAVARAVPGLAVLLPPQRPDGSFHNSSNLVKEDDSLIATAFAVRVLAH